MTPFGHIGSGLLVASAAEKLIFKGEFTAATLGMVVFLSILPDFDSIPAYLFRSWRPGKMRLDHHDYVTHTPIFYLCLSLLVWIGLGKQPALLFLLLAMTHLLLDSYGTDDGIMWFWPVSKRKYSVFPSNMHAGEVYGIKYYLRYVQNLGALLPEVLLLVGGVGAVIFWWK